MQEKRVMFVLPGMKGGGAERVAALLANEFHRNGIETSFLLTSSKREDVVRIDLMEEIPLILLDDEQENVVSIIERKTLRAVSSVVCKFYEKSGKPVPAKWAYLSFLSEYKKEIQNLRKMLQEDPDLCIIAFLQPSIPIAVLAARGLPNRIIISERGNPKRILSRRYGWNFISEFYHRADIVVFQTLDAQKAYPKEIGEKGVVIPNPLKNDLPVPYHGERKKNITTFCRIAPEKDLDVLISAFHLVYKKHSEYRLKIIGDAILDNEKKLLSTLKQQVTELMLEDAVDFLPFSKSVHKEVICDTMYVNSSETEGLSNAMLEALAIGMPVVCTDCPIGGARATIQDGENGLLVPVRDVESLYKAMLRVIEEPTLTNKLSENAAKTREEVGLCSIAQKWMELFYE